MEKDTTILKLIERLQLIIDFKSLEVVDYWEADLCAIGLKKEIRMVYISTFNYLDKSNEAKYDFDLEIVENNSERLEVLKEGRNVSEVELVDEIKAFLEV